MFLYEYNDNYEIIRVSHSFIPTDNTDCHFPYYLVFPMSITINNDEIIIGYGEGDVKSKILSNGKFINLRNHLDKFSLFITSSSKPYGIHRPRDIKFFNQPKIVFKGMFLNQEFAIDTNDYFLGMSFISIIQKNNEYSLEYLLGLLNSKYAFN